MECSSWARPISTPSSSTSDSTHRNKNPPDYIWRALRRWSARKPRREMIRDCKGPGGKDANHAPVRLFKGLARPPVRPAPLLPCALLRRSRRDAKGGTSQSGAQRPRQTTQRKRPEERSRPLLQKYANRHIVGNLACGAANSATDAFVKVGQDCIVRHSAHSSQQRGSAEMVSTPASYSFRRGSDALWIISTP